MNLPIFAQCKYKFLVWMSVNYYLRDTPPDQLNYFSSNTYHLCQGEYSKDYLLSFARVNPTKILPLVDYISDEFTTNTAAAAKKDIITFQMAKVTPILTDVFERIEQRGVIDTNKTALIPIRNMTTEQIVNAFKSSKLFIHLGWNPGMDRMPREAGVLGNIIILSTLGSGRYYNDHAFPDEYKFDLSKENVVEDIAKKVEECMIGYENRIKDFDGYRKIILGQKEKFQEDIKRIVEFIKKE